VDYDRYCQISVKCAELFHEKSLVFFTPSAFLKFKRDSQGRISILPLFHYIMRKVSTASIPVTAPSARFWPHLLTCRIPRQAQVRLFPHFKSDEPQPAARRASPRLRTPPLRADPPCSRSCSISAPCQPME
jgi:hypothetical protein